MDDTINVWLIGNGFDLAHNLPTGYISFLHTMEFLQNQNDLSKFKTIGDIFGNEELKDKAINDSYKKYSNNYNQVKFIAKPFKNLKSNIWLQYFIDCFNRDAGWIDFEKEIGNVITAFKELFKLEELLEYKEAFYFNKLKIEEKQILSHFNFFYKSSEFIDDDSPNEFSMVPHEARFSIIKNDYLIGSGNTIVNKEEIIKDLYNYLTDFSDILRSYFEFFIDCLLYVEPKISRAVLALKDADYVISFNYTSTVKEIYKKEVDHIHGFAFGSKIVLGINSDKDDETETVDTLFLNFKKYYQRVRHNTDISYLKTIDAIKKQKSENNEMKVLLTIVGHSLDVTDEDIIREVFDLADVITIYYHNENKVGDYIKNLVNLYGREGFDSLRKDKKLFFKSLQIVNFFYEG